MLARVENAIKVIEAGAFVPARETDWWCLSPDLLTWGWDCFTAPARYYWRKSNIRGELVHSPVRISHDTRFFWRTSVLAEF